MSKEKTCSKKSLRKKVLNYKVFIYAFFILMAVIFIVPMLLLFSVAFSTEADVIDYGFRFIPKRIVTTAFEFVFASPMTMINAYKVTLLYAFGVTIISVFVMAMCGYSLSREGFAYKKFVNAYLLITMFFSGGLVPGYIVRTQYFGLQDNAWVYFWSWGIGAYTIFIFRTFFKQLPKSLIESASLDGASEFQILVKIVIPLSKPILATYYLFGLLARWNDYETSLYYITNKDLYTLQYMLQKVLQDADMIKQTMQNIPGYLDMVSSIPNETLKFAICVLAALPMMIAFPFFQKYYSKGMMIGSIKG